MDTRVLSNVVFKKKNCLPAREELVNVIINSILCGDINFKEKDSFRDIEERLERIFRMEDFLRANYLIKNNKQDWDNFINEYPPSVPTEVSKFMENHKPLALVIWLLNARGVINLEDGKYLFTPVSYKAQDKYGNGQIGIAGFLPDSTFDLAGYVELWKRLGKPNSILSRSTVLKRLIALANDQPVVATKEAMDSVNKSIGHVFLKNGFNIHFKDLDVWNVCDFFGKVSTLMALKRRYPENHKVYKKPIIEIVGYLFPNFDAACALVYLKKCIPVRAEDIEHQVKDVHEKLEGYVNRKRRGPQREVKLHQPSVIRLLQEKVHYTGIEFREGTPTNWMLLPQNIESRERRVNSYNFQSMSQWEMNCNNQRALFRLVIGLENNLVDIINREAATAHDQDESGMAPVNEDDANDNHSMEIEDAPGQNEEEIAPANGNNVPDNHSMAMEDLASQDEVEINASVAPVNDDNVLDNQAMEIEDTPSQDEVEIEASIAPLNDYHHDVNHLMDHAVAHDNKEYEYSDASVNDDYHDENHPMGDVVSDDEVKNEDCNALVNDYHETIPEINSEGIPAENLYMENGMPDVEMHADSDQNQDEVMDDMDCFVNDEDDFQGFSTSSEDDSMVHNKSVINVQNLSDIDTPFAIETSTPLASSSIKVSRIVPKPKKHTKKQSSTKKRIENLNKRAPKSMIAKMRGIQASLSTQKSSKKSLKGSLSDKEAHEMGVLAVQAALLAGIAWWYFRLRN